VTETSYWSPTGLVRALTYYVIRRFLAASSHDLAGRLAALGDKG
jgi:hypothetical protein